MSQYEDYYEPSEFDEKVEEFKNYLRESVKKDTLDQIDRLEKENKKLRDEVSILKNENKELEDRNKVSVTSDIITQLIVNNIGAHWVLIMFVTTVFIVKICSFGHGEWLHIHLIVITFLVMTKSLGSLY